MMSVPRTFHLEPDSLVAVVEALAAPPDAQPTLFGFPVVLNRAMPEDEIRLVWPGGGVRITGLATQ